MAQLISACSAHARYCFPWVCKMAEEAASSGFFSNFLSELVSSPLNLTLLGLCGFLLYKIISGKRQEAPSKPPEPELPPMKKRDFTLEQLREFDGRGKDGRLLIAVNGKVFDVTRGKRFYGPGMPECFFSDLSACHSSAWLLIRLFEN